MNQMNLYQEKIKIQSQNTAQNCRDTRKCMYKGMEIAYFSSLDIIVFDEFFGSYAQRQLVADHINNNKDVYIDHIKEDFSKYVEKIRKN